MKAHFLQIQRRIIAFFDRRFHDVHRHFQFLLDLALRRVPEKPSRYEQRDGHAGQPHNQQTGVDLRFIGRLR